MKNLFKLSAFFIIFAGFFLPSQNILFAQSEFGGSINSCKKMNVFLKLDGGERVWRECGKDEIEAGRRCRRRFCNSLPKKNDNGDIYWPKESCNKYCVTFQEAIPVDNKKIKSISGNSGTDLAMNYAAMVYKLGASILGIIAILVIVVSGVQMMAGGADEGNVAAAKNRILQALLSLAMLFSSALILRTINPDFFT